MMDANRLTRLVYVSTNLVADEYLDKEIHAILKIARESNQEKDITGALLFNAGHFAQVLEGPEAHVEDLFERIQADDRHTDCMVLCCKPIATLSFSKWSMAYEGSDTVAKSQFAYMMEESDHTDKLLSADRVFKILVDHISESSYAHA